MTEPSFLRKIETMRVRVVLLVLGFICILFCQSLTTVIPYLIGLGMCLNGIFGIYTGFDRHEYRTLQTSQIATSLVMLLVGLTVFVNAAETALGFLGIVWGLISLLKGAGEVNHALYRLWKRERGISLMLTALLEISLGLILIMDPFEHFSVHVAFLGLTMIVYSFKSPAEWKEKLDEDAKVAGHAGLIPK